MEPDLEDSNHAWNVLTTLVRPLDKDEFVYVTSATEFRSSDLVEVIETQAAPPYRVARVRVLRPTTAYQICRELGLYTARRPVRFEPQIDQTVEVSVWKPGWVKGDFRTVELAWPAGAGVNYLAAQMEPGTAFRTFRVRPSYRPGEPLLESQNL